MYGGTFGVSARNKENSMDQTRGRYEPPQGIHAVFAYKLDAF